MPKNPILNFPIVDWDNAYENGGNIANSNEMITQWPIQAEAFRKGANSQLDIQYGSSERMKYDLFLPKNTPYGLMVFVHGGYWQATDKSFWSHLAQGAIKNGWAVAITGYELCPTVTIAEIIAMTGKAIEHAANQIDGPIVLTGHSAGGHLVSSMVCQDTPLGKDTWSRIQHVVPISGLSDLRPLLKTKLNQALLLDMVSATHSSPALKLPLSGIRLTAWVGGGERSEFLRQNALLANIWHGLGANICAIEEPDRHHFNVVDGLTDQDSALMAIIMS